MMAAKLGIHGQLQQICENVNLQLQFLAIALVDVEVPSSYLSTHSCRILQNLFCSENIFLGSGEYNTNVVKNIMAALNRAIHLWHGHGHGNRLWTDVNQIISTSPSFNQIVPSDRTSQTLNKQDRNSVRWCDSLTWLIWMIWLITILYF